MAERTDSDEVWLPVVGYEGLYEVSNRGRVRSLTRTVRGKHGSNMIKVGTIMKSRGDPDYLRLTLSKEGKKIKPGVHRLVAMAFIPNPLNKPEVNHEDGNKQNNDVRNLTWVTSVENKQHAIATGLFDTRRFIGENSPATKLSNKQVLDIFSKRGKVKVYEIANLYGVSREIIRTIWRLEAWTDITNPKGDKTRVSWLRSDNTSGHKGVYYQKGNRKWFVSITFRGVKYWHGYYSNKVEAILMADKVYSNIEDSKREDES